MAKLPIFHRKSAEVIASYSYTDIAEGTGMQILYLFSSEDNTAQDFHLGGNVIYSSAIVTGGNYAGGVAGRTDDDFDLSAFNMPKVIEGTGTINIAFSHEGTGCTDAQMYIKCKLRKWDGTPGAGETEIASVQSQTISDSSAAAETGTAGVFCIPITIPKTIFKKGETLRLTIEIWAGSSGTSKAWIGIDPKNRTKWIGGGNPFEISQSLIIIPFRLPL